MKKGGETTAFPYLIVTTTARATRRGKIVCVGKCAAATVRATIVTVSQHDAHAVTVTAVRRVHEHSAADGEAERTPRTGITATAIIPATTAATAVIPGTAAATAVVPGTTAATTRSVPTEENFRDLFKNTTAITAARARVCARITTIVHKKIPPL